MADALAAGETDPRTLPFDEANEAFRARGVDLMFAEIRKSLEDFGVEFDVYFHEDSLHKSGAVDHAVARLRELGHVFEADGATWLRTTDVRRRPRPRDHPVQRRGRLHRGRHRVLPGQAGARLRPRRHHARRRPPRVHRPHDGDLRGVRGHPGRQPGDPHRPAGEPGQGRRPGPDEQARRHGRDHRRPRRRRRRGRRPVRAGALVGGLDDRPGPRPAVQREEREPRVLRAVRARPHGERRPQRRRGAGSAARTASTPSLLDHESESVLLGRSPSSRGSSRRPPSCASRTASRGTSRSSPAATTSGTTSAASPRSATRSSATCTAPACG